MNGKALRMARLIKPDSPKICMVPMDHGTTYGPIDGLKDYLKAINDVVNGGVDAIVLHKGLLKEVTKHPQLAKSNYIMHLSASTAIGPDPTEKVLVSSVESAIKLGADGVSVHVNLEVAKESNMVRDLGMVSDLCMEWGMPLLAMIYSHKNPTSTVTLQHAVRLAEELGADIVKVNCPRNIKEIDELIRCVRIPVIIAGGPKTDNTKKLFSMIYEALEAGAAGVAIGRNVFQHLYPEYTAKLITGIVHGVVTLNECLYRLDEIPGNEKKGITS